MISVCTFFLHHIPKWNWKCQKSLHFMVSSTHMRLLREVTHTHSLFLTQSINLFSMPQSQLLTLLCLLDRQCSERMEPQHVSALRTSGGSVSGGHLPLGPLQRTPVILWPSPPTARGQRLLESTAYQYVISSPTNRIKWQIYKRKVSLQIFMEINIFHTRSQGAICRYR